MKKIIILLSVFLLVSCQYTDTRSRPKEEFNDDIQFLLKSLSNHPKFVVDEQLQKNIRDYLQSKLSHVKTDDELYFIVAETLAKINDAHTNIDYYSNDFNALDIQVKWFKEGLFFVSKGEGIAKGEQLIEMGNTSIDKILIAMDKVVSTENIYRLKFLSEQLLPTQVYLDYLGLINKNGTVSLKIKDCNGDIKDIILSFSANYNLFEEYYQDLFQTPFYYELDIDNNIAVYHLNFCSYSEDFILSIYNFFNQVNENNIGKIVIDIRNSPGGTTEVIDEIIKYLGVDKINSMDQSVQRLRRTQYDGKVYVLISKETFSSANGLAAVLKYYNLGILVGEPTGNSAFAYGNPKQFTLINSKIKYNIATIEVKLPADKDSDTISPDIIIQESIKDFWSGKDAVMEWVYEH